MSAAPKYLAAYAGMAAAVEIMSFGRPIGRALITPVARVVFEAPPNAITASQRPAAISSCTTTSAPFLIVRDLSPVLAMVRTTSISVPAAAATAPAGTVASVVAGPP